MNKSKQISKIRSQSGKKGVEVRKSKPDFLKKQSKAGKLGGKALWDRLKMDKVALENFTREVTK